MKRFLISIAGACAAAACSGGDAGESSANVSANAAAEKSRRPAYCFFKDEETKGWKASTDAEGNVVVEGQAHVKDARYKADMGEAEVSGISATIAPTISQNSGYAAPDNWWDVSATIPGSAAVTSVTVQCGAKTLAELPVSRGP